MVSHARADDSFPQRSLHSGKKVRFDNSLVNRSLQCSILPWRTANNPFLIALAIEINIIVLQPLTQIQPRPLVSVTNLWGLIRLDSTAVRIQQRPGVAECEIRFDPQPPSEVSHESVGGRRPKACFRTTKRTTQRQNEMPLPYRPSLSPLNEVLHRLNRPEGTFNRFPGSRVAIQHDGRAGFSI